MCDLIKEERHTSSDGKLTIFVERLAENDFIIGFEGFSWHTHPDLLGGAAKTRTFIDKILSDKLKVVVERREGEISDVSVNLGPVSEGDDLPEGVTIEHRTWSGRKKSGGRNGQAVSEVLISARSRLVCLAASNDRKP